MFWCLESCSFSFRIFLFCKFLFCSAPVPALHVGIAEEDSGASSLSGAYRSTSLLGLEVKSALNMLPAF
jgi:hypothetical protein